MNLVKSRKQADYEYLYRLNTLVDETYYIGRNSLGEWFCTTKEISKDIAFDHRTKYSNDENDIWKKLYQELSNRMFYIKRFGDEYKATILWHFVELIKKEIPETYPFVFKDKNELRSFILNHFCYFRTLSWIEWKELFPEYFIHIIRMQKASQDNTPFFTIQSPKLTKDERNNTLFSLEKTVGFIWEEQHHLYHSFRLFPSKEFRESLKIIKNEYKGIEKIKK